jgi:hypothetical protein
MDDEHYNKTQILRCWVDGFSINFNLFSIVV